MKTSVYGGSRAASVTPNDSTDFEETRGVYVGTSGDLKVIMSDGGTVTFVGLAAGIVHPLQVTRIYSTGTDADDILALY